MLWREKDGLLQFRWPIKAFGHLSNALVQGAFISKVGGKVKFCLEHLDPGAQAACAASFQHSY